MTNSRLLKATGLTGLLALGVAVASWAALTVTNFGGPTSVVQGKAYTYDAYAYDVTTTNGVGPATSADTIRYTFN